MTPSPWSLSLTGSWRLTEWRQAAAATSGHGRIAGTGSSSESLASAQTALQRAVASPAEAVSSEFPVTPTVTVTESPRTPPDSEPFRVPVPVGRKPPTLPLPAARRLRVQLTGLTNQSEYPASSSRTGPAAAPVAAGARGASTESLRLTRSLSVNFPRLKSSSVTDRVVARRLASAAARRRAAAGVRA